MYSFLESEPPLIETIGSYVMGQRNPVEHVTSMVVFYTFDTNGEIEYNDVFGEWIVNDNGLDYFVSIAPTGEPNTFYIKSKELI